MKQKLLELLKKILKEFYKTGIPGHLFTPVILFFILSSLVLAGFRVAGWYDMVMHSNNPLVELYFISMGGAIGMKWVKKDGSGG